MARKAANSVAVFGSGFQARTQLEAICTVCDIKQAKVYSRKEEKRTEFANLMRERLALDIEAVSTPTECVSGADIVVTITSAREPVFEGKDLKPGTHVNAAGGNHWMRREIDEETVNRSDLIVVDSLEQAKTECGDLLWLEARGSFRWSMVNELSEVVAGNIVGRNSEDSITVFESMGIGLEDIAAAQLVYKKAQEQGIGQELPF
jgi:ornithine cyclodeaminase/alanine dehydrogenase-like protein (mu-crystallin family)